jgi:dsDNA-binding SOS-regulon protein
VKYRENFMNDFGEYSLSFFVSEENDHLSFILKEKRKTLGQMSEEDDKEKNYGV